jgi:hypothetical protein
MIPKLYLYIYRNILNTANGRNILSSETLMFAIIKVVKRAPNIVMRDIIKEMENLKMIKKLSKNHYYIVKTKCLDKQVNRLKSQAFPIDV